MSINSGSIPFPSESSFYPAINSTGLSHEDKINAAMDNFITCANLQQGREGNRIYSMTELTTLVPQWKQNRKLTKSALLEVLDLLDKTSASTPYILRLVDVIIAQRLFQCGNKVQGIILLESLVHDKRMVHQAAKELFTLQEITPHDAIDLIHMLWCGVYFDDESMIRGAIAMGANVNGFLYGNITPLLLACSKGYQNIARILVENGANVRVVGGTHDHKTPLSEALIHGHFSPSFIETLKSLDGGFTRDFNAIKKIAHFFSALTPNGQFNLGGQLFELKGWRTRYSLTEYLRTAQPYYEGFKTQLKEHPEVAFRGAYEQLSAATIAQLESPEIRTRLCEAIDRTVSAMESSLKAGKEFYHASGRLKDFSRSKIGELMEKIDNGEPVICFDITRYKAGDPELHAWGFVCFKEPDGTYTVKKCDRSTEPTGIFSKNISREDLVALLGHYLKATNWKRDFNGTVGGKYHRAIHNFFAYSDENGTQRNPEFVGEKSQRIGNCCYYSAQSLELATLIGLFEQVLGKSQDAVLLAKKVKNARTSTIRVEELKQFIGTGSGTQASTSSSRDSSGTPKDGLLSGIYYHSIQSDKLKDTREVFLPYESHYDSILNDQALLCAWQKIIPAIRRIDKSLDFAGMRKLNPSEIREFLLSHGELLQQVTKLEFAALDMKVFPPELFLFTGLEELIMRKVGLKRLPELHFPHLKKLNISENYLQEIPRFNLPELQELDAGKNLISQVPDLRGIPDLTCLNLSYNQLADVGSRLPEKIETLHLAGNRLNDVDLSYLTRLTNLFLSHNPLGKFPGINAPQLNSLYIDSIGLREMTPEDEERLNQHTQLTWLNISGNLLSRRPVLNLKSDEVVMHGNPFEEEPS